MLTTTLKAIRKHGPCEEGWAKLLAHLGKTKADDEPLAFEVILDSNGLDDALWCCRSAPQYDRVWRLFACDCAERVAYLNDDPRVRDCIDAARRYAKGEATDDDLRVARDAAWAAARDAARAAAWAAAWGVAWAAALDAAEAAAWDAAWDAARAAARDAEREWQTERFRQYVRGEIE